MLNYSFKYHWHYSTEKFYWNNHPSKILWFENPSSVTFTKGHFKYCNFKNMKQLFLESQIHSENSSVGGLQTLFWPSFSWVRVLIDWLSRFSSLNFSVQYSVLVKFRNDSLTCFHRFTTNCALSKYTVKSMF